ncbi:malectin domain-containing carbohydrate-binding protein [Zobellia nedashkovskayae]|uniref:malectin domain-containing carbohydrate-binding protein n=1 Tax=Zobellia nedashkovskayae TaxID=2779510 RepID=UPI00188AAD2C|nr:malectin domain-containing carbohydrate-binding protein [Zobellia nedashkovskayae]
MRRNLITKWFLFSMLFVSFIMVPVACSSDDGGTETEQTPDSEPEPEPEPEPAPVPDPTNENTIIDATAAAHANGVSTSTVTVQLADADGKLLTASGGVVALLATGSSTLSDVTDNADGTYTATVSGTVEESIVVSGTLDGVAITSTVEITFNPDESNPAQEADQSTKDIATLTTLLRINCGGEEVTYGDITFEADIYFGENSEAFTNPFVTEIAGTEMDEIYLTERVSANGPNSKGPTTYNIPATNGTYTVKLHFAEIYWGVENEQNLDGGEGSRIFNILMEDAEIFTGYDLFKDNGGPATAGTRIYDVEVTDGELNITLEATVNKPKISAIEIFGTGTIGS